ncbi:Transketolase 1 [Candidatus Arcanobacter lacustris]|uniref:Transketolase n=1 Tax=Candidatus Arcanibacter lacustris TaxID=1607817 RepID=A0A0F5MNK4_9RICK|nr:Transketolase 1 [Candidatus Arcanobacter lacustris]
MIDNNKLKSMANAIRILAIDAIEKSNSGHPGIVMGMADVATILFSEFLKFNPKVPDWQNRDRFILSAGHGSMLLYALAYLTGYDDMSLDDLKSFRQLNSKTPGHPEHHLLSGIETTTGPLGQGLANGVGMAIAKDLMAAEFDNILDHKTYVIVGDGCLMEGISQEAISLAGHLKLKDLIVLFDDNQITIDGPTNISTSDDQIARFKASNWHVISIDGHDFNQIRSALNEAIKSNKPTMIACRTIIGYGSPNKSGTSDIHGSSLGKDEIALTRKNLGWENQTPFAIPDNILNDWRSIATSKTYDAWMELYNNLPNKLEFDRRIKNELPAGLEQVFIDLKTKAQDIKEEATRKSSGKVLEALIDILPELVGGSADLTPSNNTKTNNKKAKYIHYGIREHAMAGVMNGISLYKGFIPYGGTFLVFSDYCRNAIRLSALMKQRVVYVMTHDSIGLGEDGPTHQPVEHLASLRAIPNLLVFRPCDLIETIEAWQIAINNPHRPSIIALSRQNLPLLRSDDRNNLSEKGAYILAESSSELKVTIFATGSEVQLAIEARNKLQAMNIGCRVVSMVCWSLFEEQDKSYQDHLLNNNSIKVGVEAAIRLGWDRYIGRDGIFIGMDGFGASAPIADLYQYFGITVDRIIQEIKNENSN